MRVHGDGPLDASVMLVGEAPGFYEDLSGLPFQGAAGEVLDFLISRTLAHINLPRHRLYITNLVKERPPENMDPTPAMIARDEAELRQEITEIAPSFILTLGRIPLRWFLGHDDFQLETLHGIPIRCPRHDTILLPCYHPAAALHKADLWPYLLYDFQLAAEAIIRRRRTGSCLVPRQPAQTQYLDLRDDNPAHHDYLDRLLRHSPLGLDTEDGPDDSLWSIQLSHRSGQGCLVSVDQPRLLDALRDGLHTRRPRVILQHAVHELEALPSVGIHLDDDQFDDTMILAYLLQMEPQGLKELGYRWAGMEMRSYTEVVAEAERDQVAEYFARLQKRWREHREALREEALARYVDDQLQKGRKTIRTTLRKSDEPKRPAWVRAVDRCMVGEKPRRQWENQNPEVHAQVEALGLSSTIPPTTLADVPRAEAVDYGVADADADRRVFPSLRQRVADAGMEPLYQMTLGVAPMVARMIQTGILVDVDYMTGLGKEFDREFDEICNTIERMLGEPCIPTQFERCAEVLFGHLGLPFQKMTKGGSHPSTDDKTLEALVSHHPVVQWIIDGREVSKMKGTYAHKVPRMVDGNGRLHDQFKLTRTASGRRASQILLTIPKHSERGKKVRNGFIVPEGCLFQSIDLDQIEMRVMAHLSEDEGLCRVFEDGRDVHADTAELIFGVKAEDQDESLHRYPAKTTNYLVLMGGTGYGLWEQFQKNHRYDWSQNDCDRFIAEWYKARPGCARYRSARHAEARRFGYITDMWGRRYYLPSVHAKDQSVSRRALREAQAIPLQAGAVGVMLLWEREVWGILKDSWRRGVYVEPILQFHDDILIEHEEKAGEELEGRMLEAIPQVLRVPVSGEAKHGERWGKLKNGEER